MMVGRRVVLAVVAVCVWAVCVGSWGCAQRSLLSVRESGITAYERGEYDRALADFEEYIERSPGHWQARAYLGRTLLAMGRTRQAREHLWVAYSQRLEDDEVFDWLAEGLYADGQYDELYRLLRQRTIDRGTPGDYVRLAEYAMRTGDPDEARRALLTAARIDRGRSAEVQIALADFYEAIGDEREALRRLRMAYYLSPGDTELAERIRGYGEVPGPTFGIVPTERGG